MLPSIFVGSAYHQEILLGVACFDRGNEKAVIDDSCEEGGEMWSNENIGERDESGNGRLEAGWTGRGGQLDDGAMLLVAPPLPAWCML